MPASVIRAVFVRAVQIGLLRLKPRRPKPRPLPLPEPRADGPARELADT